jgi:hypothetical protein
VAKEIEKSAKVQAKIYFDEMKRKSLEMASTQKDKVVLVRAEELREDTSCSMLIEIDAPQPIRRSFDQIYIRKRKKTRRKN